ncbi:hypothetical protein CFOL_v3_24119 [Cephalotus follicularis]|uniref:Uncharacterized protein n=1 Tax=Cephalotus follicularis TaxID=3775 RepID=A0A1Q3CK91_CEPFO|nr:hypothetical protein CFOL_v3_24119 [Cephalotus follicularis]
MGRLITIFRFGFKNSLSLVVILHRKPNKNPCLIHLYFVLFLSLSLSLFLSLMASQGRKRVTNSSSADAGVLARVSHTVSESPIVKHTKRLASDAGFVTMKLIKSTGKAAWIAGTTLIILVVPLIIEMDREQQLNDLELQQQSLLGAPPTTIPPAPK